MAKSGKKVFVAGPYTNGDVAANVARAIEAGEELTAMGYAPFIPHLFHFWHLKHQHSYSFWIDLDEVWLQECDVFVRLPGPSPGADREEELARSLGMSVFMGVRELKQYVVCIAGGI